MPGLKSSLHQQSMTECSDATVWAERQSAVTLADSDSWLSITTRGREQTQPAWLWGKEPEHDKYWPVSIADQSPTKWLASWLGWVVTCNAHAIRSAARVLHYRNALLERRKLCHQLVLCHPTVYTVHLMSHTFWAT